MTFRALAACAVLCLSLTASAFAQSPSNSTASIKLAPVNQLRKGVDVWPLIQGDNGPVATRINATLTRLNNTMLDSLKQCDADYRDWAKQVNQPLTGENAVDKDWQRAVAVTMTGPGYLSLVATDNYVFCGGAHPNTDTFALVFDLSTGRPVNWMNLVAKSANASAFSDSITDGTKVGAMILPALRAITIAKADKDCKDVFDDSLSYQLWPDAKTGTLVAEPFDLPHAVAACADDLQLTLDQARKLGFSESLLSAIDQAHRQVGKH